MRISDWSSDVCSSDLGAEPPVGRERLAIQGGVVVAQEAVWPARLYFTDMPGLQHAGIVVAHDPKLDMGVYFAVGGGGFLDIVVEDAADGKVLCRAIAAMRADAHRVRIPHKLRRHVGAA